MRAPDRHAGSDARGDESPHRNLEKKPPRCEKFNSRNRRTIRYPRSRACNHGQPHSLFTQHADANRLSKRAEVSRRTNRSKGHPGKTMDPANLVKTREIRARLHIHAQLHSSQSDYRWDLGSDRFYGIWLAGASWYQFHMKPKPPKTKRQLADLAGVGPATLKDFELLKIRSLEELARADAQKLYDKLCRLTGARHDICVLDVFSCAIAQARDPHLPPAQRQWHWWSRKRKSARPSFTV